MKHLPQGESREAGHADREGVVAAIDTRALGLAVVRSAAGGRARRTRSTIPSA